MPTQEVDWEIKKVEGSQVARVFSPTNIALAKYWGKRDVSLNLPTNGSLSATLDKFGSFTTVEFNKSFKEDFAILNGSEHKGGADPVMKKIFRVLNELRKIKGDTKLFARVQSKNNFPTGAGLASSASGLSAVTLAGATALGVEMSLEELSGIARQGSGSACRSLFGGFVEWTKGNLADGSDSLAHQVEQASHWPLGVFIAVVNKAEKKWLSTDAMTSVANTSPYFKEWTRIAEEQLGLVREAIAKKDFLALAETAESNCLRMHATGMAAAKPILYWEPQTLEVIHKVWKLREKGISVFFTIDAGPNVVLFFEKKHEEEISKAIGENPQIEILRTKIGEGARIL